MPLPPNALCRIPKRRADMGKRDSWLLGVGSFVLAIGLLASFSTKSSEDPTGDVNETAIPAVNSQYVVLAWNDLGMHCLNPTYDQEVILPPTTRSGPK